MTIALLVVSVVLGALSVGLFIVAFRRVVGEQTDAVTDILERYDVRLASFTRTIQAALDASPLEGTPVRAGGSGSTPDDDHAMTRTLELARANTATDAAIAIVTEPNGPTVATVGLSQEEAADVTRMGLPDYRGARALELSFNGKPAIDGREQPIRSGLAVSLLDSPSMLAVLTRSPQHRFTEEHVDFLHELVGAARAALERSRA